MVLGGKWYAPAGTNFWLQLAVLHESASNFTEAKRFHPERWLEQQSADAANGKQRSSDDMPAAEGVPTPLGNSANLTKSWLPFSTGPRDCVGQAMAMMNIRCVLMVRVLGILTVSGCPNRSSCMSDALTC
jgi:cytochrome P450